jgi:tRNA1Val (adenine37-N6)-methyltransferase
MPNKPFRFKQFEIYQDHSAMKVGTDAILLSVWARVTKCYNILDVGTGTGIISLICAQRNSQAIIEGVEIDAGGFEDATLNFSSSPWKDRLQAHHCDFLDFETDKTYDVIISNPPYFSNSLRASDPSRSAARHDDSLPAQAFLEKSAKLLKKEGVLAVIFPTNQMEKWEAEAKLHGLYSTRICKVFTVPNRESQRVMVEYKTSPLDYPEMESVLIEKSPGQSSEHFKFLTRDFFLKAD